MPRMWWWWLLFVRFVSYISFIVYGYFLCCEFELLYGETACDRWEDAFWLGWLIQNVAIRQNAKWFREMYNIFNYHSANIFKISKITLHPYSCNILGLHAFILLFTNSLQGWWDTVHIWEKKKPWTMNTVFFIVSEIFDINFGRTALHLQYSTTKKNVLTTSVLSVGGKYVLKQSCQ